MREWCVVWHAMLCGGFLVSGMVRGMICDDYEWDCWDIDRFKNYPGFRNYDSETKI